VKNRQLEVVKYLIEKGAAKDYALKYSVTNGHLEIVKYLVENGAVYLKLFLIYI